MDKELERVTNVDIPAEAHTVLIVDDNPVNLGVLSDYLKDSGLRILVARSGESALKKARYATPDIILLDVMMPGIDGFETCHRLKADERTQDIPIIFMTALAEAEDKVKGFRMGAVDYITKPLQHEEVLARVNTHLEIRDLTRSLQAQNVRLQQMTAALQTANAALSDRNTQLEISSQVGHQVTSLLNMDELLPQVVSLIQTKFDYYFVGVWVRSRTGDKIDLRAGAGVADIHLPDEGMHIPLTRVESAIVWVCLHGQSYLSEDVSKASVYLALEPLPDVKSELVLPLRVGPDVIGVLDILSDYVNAFTSEDRIVLQMLADQIAVAVRNARLYKQEKQRRRLAEALVHTGQVISGDLDLRQVPERILEELAGVVPYKRGAVLLQEGPELRSVAVQGYPSEYSAGDLQIFIDEGGVFRRIIDSLAPLLLDDVTVDPGWQQLEWLPLDHSWLGVPLISKGQVIGMISLTRREKSAFTRDDATSVLAFAGQAAVALENAGLYEKINRFNEQLEQKVAHRTEELKDAYRVLERLDQKKSDFIHITSHELRTPLSVIRGYTQILQVSLGQDQKNNELLQGVIQGVDRLNGIVDTMLDVVKIESQALQVGHEPTLISKIMAKIGRKFKASLQERRLHLTIEGMESLPPIEANPDLIYKVFHNLVINAIKYTPDGGRITISGQPVARTNGIPSIEVVVSDTGIGIDPEHQAQIFEKFYQAGEVAVHSTGLTKFKGGGPGLGLAIVKGIISAHRGQIWVESEEYNETTCPGSRFYVILPVAQTPAGNKDEAEAEPNP